MPSKNCMGAQSGRGTISRSSGASLRGLYVAAMLFMLCILRCSFPMFAEAQSFDELTELSLVELLEIPVTSVAKKPQSLAKAASAIYVLTAEDIRRSGMRSVPEVLRLVPGVEVARLNAHSWAINARGFNGLFANKLLVLVDGRSVYNPLFAGVIWDEQQIMLNDIERIEVIRGPGATIWGPNAVNGVINIITKHTSETTGGLISGGGGTHEEGFGAVRWGGAVGDNWFYRIFGQGRTMDAYQRQDGSSNLDGTTEGSIGFRADGRLDRNDILELHGNVRRFDSRDAHVFGAEELSTDLEDTGGNFLVRWGHEFENGNDSTLQFFIDTTDRQNPTSDFEVSTADLDFQHNLTLSAQTDLSWGLNGRVWYDEFKPGKVARFSPLTRTSHLIGGFVQGSHTLLDDRLTLIAGTKLDRSSYTGFELQPSVRASWAFSQHDTLWAAVSRAVRTGARTDEDIAFPLPGVAEQMGVPVISEIRGNSSLDSEELTALEAGFRTSLVANVSLDIAAFYNIYKDLSVLRPLDPEARQGPMIVAPFEFANDLHGQTYGAEVAIAWQALESLRIHASYSYLEFDLKPDVDRDVLVLLPHEGNSPENQVKLRAYVDLPYDLELDTLLFFVDDLSANDIDSYWRLDARLGWRIMPGTRLSAGVQNLLDEDHKEFESGGISARSALIPRSVWAELTWEF